MEYNIYDLMDEFADEDIELSPYNAADLRRIEELTMKKLRNSRADALRQKRPAVSQEHCWSPPLSRRCVPPRWWPPSWVWPTASRAISAT